MRLFLASLFVFLASVLMGRRAQSNEVASHTLSFAQPFVDLLRTQDQGLETLRNTMEEGNIQGVVSLLQNHIKQWSFIEAQLLEPNVNLGMPEIFIPLKHLTTTLQTLGSIFLMKNDLQEAKVCLERACPLMELLPTTIDDTYKLDAFAFANAYFEADVDSNGQAKTPLEDGEDFQGNYAANCFALLRSVYMRIYDKQQQQQQQQQLDTQRVVPPSIQRNKPSSIRPVKMATIKTRNPPVRFLAAEDEEYEDYYDEYMALLDKIHGDGEEAESRVGKIVTQAENERCESGAGKQEDSTAAIEDLIEQLRQPFQHLRSEILLVRNQDTSSSVGSKQRKDEKKTMKERYLQETEGRFEDDSHADSPSSQSKKTKKRMREEWEQSTKIQYESNLFKDEDFLLPSYLEREDLERELGLRRDQTMTASDTDDTDPFGLGSTGSSTSIVSSDLEIMLRKFVKEDSQGRKKILKQASHYYSDLHTNFPYMDYNEYAANMDLGVVYLEVMERVVKEGFDFIAPELERWQDVGQALILKSAKLTRLEDKDDRELIDEASMGILGIVWELDPESGKKKEYSVELDGNYFDAFSLHERNRLLVLSAFDIAAHLEPAEHFDLSLGFSLGILDNDRSRQREQEQLELEGPDGGSLKSKKKRSKQPQGKLDKVVSAALFEEQTSPAIGISSSFRSSVPTLSLENDWSFHIFLFFLFLTFAIVVASHLSASKKKTRIRTRPAKRTSPYEQLIYALCRPVAALFSVADPNDENDETVPEALSNIIKSWQVQATAEWILGGMRKTLLVEFPQFLWTKGFAMLAGDGKGSKKVAEKDKSKPSKDTVTSSISSLASPFEDLDVAKKTAPEPVSLQSTVASDLRKAKVPKPSDLVEEREKSGKGKTVIFADQLEDDHSHNATNKAHTTASSISPKSALAKSFRSAFAVEEAGAMQEERVTEQKADRNVSDTSNKQQKKVENTYSRKNGQNLNATTSTNTAHSHSFPHQSAAGTSVATQEDLGWYDWQEVSKPKADEGWTEAKRKPTHKQKENKKGAQPSAVAVPFQKSAPAPALSVVAAPTNPNPQGTGAQKTSISVKKAYVKAPVGVEGAKRPVGFEELLAKQTMSLNLEDHIAKPTLGKPVSNSAAPSSPSLDSMHAPGLYPSDSIAKGITYKNVVANEVSPSLLPPTADETDSMSSWMSQTFLGNSIFASTTSNNNMLSGLHESTADDSSSLFYRLGLAAYSGDTVRTGAPTISTLSAPPGLERKVHQMPTAGMYNHSTVNGLSSHYNMNMSLRSQRDMEQDMEQDMESQNLLQGILGDILHPSSPILEQNAQHKMSALNSSTGLFGTSTYNHSPTMSFLYSNSMSNAGRDTEQSNLSAQSDLSPLAPVFDPTKGLVLQEEDAIDTTSSLWDWNHE